MAFCKYRCPLLEKRLGMDVGETHREVECAG
jgi:hypothetical protein